MRSSPCCCRGWGIPAPGARWVPLKPHLAALQIGARKHQDSAVCPCPWQDKGHTGVLRSLRGLRTGRSTMSGEHGTGTIHGNLSSDPAQQQPPVPRPLRGTAAARSLFPLGALTGDVSHSPYPSSQLPPCQPAFLQVEGSSPRPAICSSSDKSQRKEQHTNKALHILNTGTVRRHSRAGGGLNPTAEEHCPRTVPQGHQCHLGRKVSRAAIPKPHSSTAHNHTQPASETQESADQQWEM